MKSVEIGRLAGAFPHELSGGEQQRVALARALAPRPDIIFLDEPFSSLDRRLRSELRQQTIETIKQSGAAALIVTHDADEAFETAEGGLQQALRQGQGRRGLALADVGRDIHA